MARDVFEEDPLKGWPEFTGDPCDMGPQVARIIRSLSLARHAEWLTRIASQQGVDGAGERSGVEGGEVIPDRGRGEVSGALCRDEDAAGVFLPLDKASGVKSRLGEHEAHIEASAA